MEGTMATSSQRSLRAACRAPRAASQQHCRPRRPCQVQSVQGKADTAAPNSSTPFSGTSTSTQVVTAEAPVSSGTATPTSPAPLQPAVPVEEAQITSSSQAYPASADSDSIASTSASTSRTSNGKRSIPAPTWTAQTAAISVSGPYITTSSIDGDSMIMSSQFLERELAGPYRFTQHQKSIIHELTENMQGCSTAFVAVALAGIALSVAAESGVSMEDAPEVLFNGITVGDVASWVDSLLVAYLLRFGASSFSRVEETVHEERQLAYTFQGINRLGLMFTQFSIAAATVSIVTTLEAASKWPPLVTLASGLFFLAAVGRSGAMWYVLNKYGTKLDDVDAALEAQRRCYQAAHDEELPLADRLAIRLAFSYLLQYSAAGRQPSEAALSAAAVAVISANGATEDEASSAGVDSRSGGIGSSKLAAATAAAAVAIKAGGRSATAAAAQAAKKGMAMLQKIPMPIISRSTESEDDDSQVAMQQQQQQYVLTQAEERLVQACQSSLNNAGLCLVLQSFATGLLLTAHLANAEYSESLADAIQVINKAVAAELIFVGTTNFDKALYTEGCDVEHLLEGLGQKGITKLFHNLSILAWAVVIAKGVELLAPWEEQSPLLKFISENFSHQAADMVLEGQELLVNIMQ